MGHAVGQLFGSFIWIANRFVRARTLKHPVNPTIYFCTYYIVVGLKLKCYRFLFCRKIQRRCSNLRQKATPIEFQALYLYWPSAVGAESRPSRSVTAGTREPSAVAAVRRRIAGGVTGSPATGLTGIRGFRYLSRAEGFLHQISVLSSALLEV